MFKSSGFFSYVGIQIAEKVSHIFYANPFNHVTGHPQENYWFWFFGGVNFIYLGGFFFLFVFFIYGWSIHLGGLLKFIKYVEYILMPVLNAILFILGILFLMRIASRICRLFLLLFS